MIIDDIKDEITLNINREVLITEYGLRNKINKYRGKIYAVYPNIFTILINGEQKSFTYAEVVTKDIVITYI